ncbi:MAG TPA: hypothetical protein VNS53_03000 [Sphingomicrobium sp.]|nr:hypothetical protein [Sphingomicrobium sp.]
MERLAMNFGKTGALIALAIAAAACSQGNSGNVMAPEANALEPADVNAALGPEVNTSDMNMTANDMNAFDNNAAADEPATNNAAE